MTNPKPPGGSQGSWKDRALKAEMSIRSLRARLEEVDLVHERGFQAGSLHGRNKILAATIRTLRSEVEQLERVGGHREIIEMATLRRVQGYLERLVIPLTATERPIDKETS